MSTPSLPPGGSRQSSTRSRLFLQHSALETLSVALEDNYAFALTHADISASSGAWPKLVHAPARSFDKLLPIVTVLDFVAACPRLETLVLCVPLDCTTRDTWRDAAIPPHPLRGLFLGLDAETGSYRPDKTWRALAAVLDRCFLHLDVRVNWYGRRLSGRRRCSSGRACCSICRRSGLGGGDLSVQSCEISVSAIRSLNLAFVHASSADVPKGFTPYQSPIIY